MRATKAVLTAHTVGAAPRQTYGSLGRELQFEERMDKMKSWRKRLAACIVCLMFVGGSLTVLAAVQGSQENPLVTLGYLKDVFTKSMLQEADKKISESKSDYEKKLDSKVTAYTEEMKKLQASGGGSSAGGAVFSVVDLSAGQTLVGSVGCEVMLRVGSAVCLSPASPGLVDSTTGGTLEGGQALEQNHLYMMTIEGRSVKAEGGAVKLLVRGSYTIQ